MKKFFLFSPQTRESRVFDTWDEITAFLSETREFYKDSVYSLFGRRYEDVYDQDENCTGVIGLPYMIDSALFSDNRDVKNGRGREEFVEWFITRYDVTTNTRVDLEY
jgi:hypothetical protein